MLEYSKDGKFVYKTNFIREYFLSLTYAVVAVIIKETNQKDNPKFQTMHYFQYSN